MNLGYGCTEPGKSAAASPGELLVVSAAAHVAGAQGTNWRSDLEIHNLGDELGVFNVFLLEHGADKSDPDSVELSLAAGQSLRLGDVLDAEFGLDGAALALIPSSGRIVANSRTFNLLGSGNALGLPPGATFGQYIQGVTDDEAIGWGEHGQLIQLAHSVDDGSGFRTNLVLVNTVADRIDVKVDL